MSHYVVVFVNDIPEAETFITMISNYIMVIHIYIYIYIRN